MTAKNSEYQRAILQVMGLSTYESTLAPEAPLQVTSEPSTEPEDLDADKASMELAQLSGSETLKQDIQMALETVAIEGTNLLFSIRAGAEVSRSAEGIVLPCELNQLTARHKQRLWSVISQR
ncbi:hypothetical protein QTP81_05520 [Alteromonas sp. ASW11-36]|uniref:Uncharacterized protein n=1 Tax=Alteromonas arenosi TaxID=3055817 RepID=A0ABT7SV28_9ALTE|nr:hypothetical protein [Alteromonas sp. ASW11-36]MDM7860052.1 hypothetical protein [Alteromonas sp. ASW11-36]